MKKHFRKLAIILSLALSVCSLAGCGKKEDAQKDTLTVAFRNEPAVSYRITCNNGNQRPLINP